MYKCLHYRICHSYVTDNGRGWVHTPSNRRYWMEHTKYSKKQVKNSQLYNFGMDGKNGCGWKGAAPADEITIKNDICPGCGAVGELGDNHIASPVYPKRRGRRRSGVISKRTIRSAIRKLTSGGGHSAPRGKCTAACRAATSSECNCVCNGTWHGTIVRL